MALFCSEGTRSDRHGIANDFSKIQAIMLVLEFMCKTSKNIFFFISLYSRREVYLRRKTLPTARGLRRGREI